MDFLILTSNLTLCIYNEKKYIYLFIYIYILSSGFQYFNPQINLLSEQDLVFLHNNLVCRLILRETFHEVIRVSKSFYTTP